MYGLKSFLVALFGLFIFFSTLSWFISLIKRKRANAEEAARRGCAPAPRMPKRYLFGFGRLIENIWATRHDWGPQYVVKALNEEMGKDVHTVVQPIFDYEVLVTRDPVNIQTVLATQSQDWDTGEHRSASWKPLVGEGIFTQRGEAWKHSRALIRPQFALDQINDLDLFERHVELLFDALDMRQAYDFEMGWTNQFNMQTLFYNMTLDITTEMIYGYSVHSQMPEERFDLPEVPGCELPDLENIGKHMDDGKAWIETRGALWKYRWLLPTSDFEDDCAALARFGDYFVHLRLQRGDKYLENLGDENKKDAGNDKDKAANKNRYVLLHELAKLTQDPVELRSQTLNVLTAGRDTTSALMGWMFYFMSRHPKVYYKLRKEVHATFGRCTTHQEPEGFDFRKLRDNMPYMHAVINESLRLAPVVPLNERVALRDTVLPRGGGPNCDQPVFVPKGTQVLIPVYALQMREDIWGEDVEEFRPERWIENGRIRKTGFEFLPFGGGVRQCLGQQFARTMTAYVTCRILQRYKDIKCAEDPPQPIRFHHTIENRSGTGVWIKLREEGYVQPKRWPEHIPKRDMQYLYGEAPTMYYG